MKPVITWVLLANGHEARIVENRGPGKGLTGIADHTWQAQEFPENSDKHGASHSSAGHASSGYEGASAGELTEIAFADDLAKKLEAALSQAKFDRLIITAGPKMLAKLRDAIPETVKQVTTAELDKDLTSLSADKLEDHLVDFVRM